LASRAEQHLSEEPAIAVIIQKMIFSEVSGAGSLWRSLAPRFLRDIGCMGSAVNPE
jgi:hypothetical protein